MYSNKQAEYVVTDSLAKSLYSVVLAENPVLAIGELERKLLASLDPLEILDCVKELVQVRPGRSLSSLNCKVLHCSKFAT